MEAFNYSLFKSNAAESSQYSDDLPPFLLDKDFFNTDDVSKTKTEENLHIGDKESSMFEAVCQDDSSRFISLTKPKPEKAAGRSDRKDGPFSDQETLDPGIASKLLQLACRLNSVECARALIEGDIGTVVQINEVDESGRTPLHTAAGMHSAKCIDVLLQKNASTDMRSKDEDSLLALKTALSSKRMQIDWSPKESVEELLVLLSERERDLRAIKLLVDAIKDVVEVSYIMAIEGRIVELAALLLVAADKILSAVCIHGEHSLSSKNRRTIHEVVVEEAMALFQMEKMAKSNCYQKRRRLLLCEIELIQMFGPVLPVDRDNYKKKKVLPPLLLASKIGDEPVAKLLLQAGASSSETDTDGNSALHLCLNAGSISPNLRLMWLLLKHGAKIPQQNQLGITPIHLAASNGYHQALELLLLQAPECVDLASAMQETPLFFAARNGSLDCTKLLLQYGANCQAINLRRQRPIDVASSQDIRFILNPVNQGFSYHHSNRVDDDHAIFCSAEKSLNEIHEHGLQSNHEFGRSESPLSSSTSVMKAKICCFYGSPKGCVKDTKCNFAHVESALGPSKLSPTSRNLKIFVGGLPLSVDSECLKESFEAEFGPVEDATVITTKAHTQIQSRGFGFVTFKQEVTVRKAIEAHFIIILNKKVEIKSIERVRSLAPSFSQPPWVLKFKKWLPAFLKRACNRLGNEEGYPLSSIKADFRAICGMELDHLSLGFLKLSDFIRAFPDLCKMRVATAANGLATHMVLYPSNSRLESLSYESKQKEKIDVDTVESRLKDTGLTDVEGCQVSGFSLFERQCDYYAVAHGRCTVCFSESGSLSIIPCNHKVCRKCLNTHIELTCIYCGGKVQGFRYPENTAALLNPTDYLPLGKGKKKI